MKNILYMVIPCFNEEEVLPDTIKVMDKKMKDLIKKKKIDKSSKVMFVNDGSSDKTWDIIEKISKKNSLFTGISLSRNKGHQNALVAGLLVSKDYADMVISMDADLQDDVNTIDKMVDEYLDGAEIVYAVRSARKKDSFFKRFTAESFYKFMSKMGVDIIYNHADFRLTSKRVLDSFSKYHEVNLFLRGIFPLIGYKSSIVYYERGEREKGESKYPLSKMVSFAWDGITSFSTKPIKMILYLGLIEMIISFISLIIFIILNFNTGSIIAFMVFLSGIQIFCIGIVGEYIGKTYFETKQRPRYFIDINLMEKKNGRYNKKNI